MQIQTATTEAEISRCFQVMLQLRPHLNEKDFPIQVRRQMENHGYSLVYIEIDGEVKAAAGYRVAEYLAWGKTLYVDDLITNATDRGQGLGNALMDWLIDKARELGCQEFHLDSGVQRFDAHRLYLMKKMIISSHHFSKSLKQSDVI